MLFKDLRNIKEDFNFHIGDKDEKTSLFYIFLFDRFRPQKKKYGWHYKDS